jgi:predicted Zn finger-like uncharacterized protein
MALATKCPHCHTVFRVALDQLKLRGGIVRCGACNEIFDGNAALVEPVAAPPAVPKLDLELDLDERPISVAEPSAAAGRPGAGPENPAPALASVVNDPPAIHTRDHPLESGPQGQAPGDAVDLEEADSPPPKPAPVSGPVVVDTRREPAFDMPSEHIVAVALDDLHHFDDDPEPIVPAPAPAHAAGDDAEDNADEGANEVANEAAQRVADDAAAADLLAAAPESALLAAGACTAAAARDDDAYDGGASDEEPEFVRQAARRERSRHLARLAMLAGIPLLALVLLGQGVYGLRNRLAADHPALKPALQALCAPLGCTVELPRQIDALAIEQGELQTLAPNTFSFVTVLRNQSRSVQAWPHIELVLNDAADKPVLRRVFAPRDYLGNSAAAAPGFRPRSEQAVKLYFELDRLRASGYHIAIFYP